MQLISKFAELLVKGEITPQTFEEWNRAAADAQRVRLTDSQGAMAKETSLREQVAKLLSWEDAHVSFDAAVANLPEALRGMKPAGLPYSPWQLLEHLRITQHDILDFCRDPAYRELTWPDDYWPPATGPSSPAAWEDSVTQFQRDQAQLQQLARDPAIELEARIPHGSGQTYLRELLLAADHAAYHIGELIVVRRLLGAWSKG